MSGKAIVRDGAVKTIHISWFSIINLVLAKLMMLSGASIEKNRIVNCTLDMIFAHYPAVLRRGIVSLKMDDGFCSRLFPREIMIREIGLAVGVGHSRAEEILSAINGSLSLALSNDSGVFYISELGTFIRIDFGREQNRGLFLIPATPPDRNHFNSGWIEHKSEIGIGLITEVRQGYGFFQPYFAGKSVGESLVFTGDELAGGYIGDCFVGQPIAYNTANEKIKNIIILKYNNFE